MRILSRLARAGTPALLAAFCVLPAGAAWAGAFSVSAHGNLSILPQECASCHVGHGTPQTAMFRTSEEATCLQCHGDAGTKSTAQVKGLLRGPGNPVNIAAEFAKSSPHPLEGVSHPTTQTLLTRTPTAGPPALVAAAPPSSSASKAIVSCSSCHDPHYLVKSTSPAATTASVNTMEPKAIQNARGARQPEYKICYNCHGSGAARDIQRLMRPSNPSYHPLEAPGRNSVVPSLIQPYTAQSYVGCTDCHGSDQANVRGPHGSAFHPILKNNFTKEDYQAESAFEYALCYNCHNRSIVLSAASFSQHTLHVVTAKTSCHTCHDSHGAALYGHLISFDPTVVFGSSKGLLNYQSLGPQHGVCNLLCHGHDHVQKKY